MSAADAVRLVAALAQCEIALVRRDPVAAALLAQAARHAEGRPEEPLVAAAAALARATDVTAAADAARAARKAVQSLCRAALQSAQAELLAGAGRGP